MIDGIFRIFYEKLPSSIEDVLPRYDKCKLITFLTPYYMTLLDESEYDLYKEFDYIASDGSYALKVGSWVGRPKSLRLSFDMTSVAPIVFSDLIKNKRGLYVLGAKPGEVEQAVNTIRTSFPDLIVSGYRIKSWSVHCGNGSSFTRQNFRKTKKKRLYRNCLYLWRFYSSIYCKNDIISSLG